MWDQWALMWLGEQSHSVEHVPDGVDGNLITLYIHKFNTTITQSHWLPLSKQNAKP